jgi:hypothetical protein
MDVQTSPIVHNPADLLAPVGVLRFSIIIPLEFHRGQGLECLRGWTREQTFPRDQFEIVMAIPPGLPESDLNEMRALLSAHDQALFFSERHDIGLCAAAAQSARGEYLFFTESHCLPEPDTLVEVERALAAHPEWAGFSCESVPITHNLLSKVEAGLYQHDIHAAMEHPWRNILDQCFVTSRKAYLSTGGFEGSLGHFAEWVLSARYRQQGLKLGYWPAAKIHHYYVGCLDEWREFTEDFTEGEMNMLSRAERDPILDWFDEIPEWAARHEISRGRAWRMMVMLAKGLRGKMQKETWKDLAAWTTKGLLGAWAVLIPAHWRVWKSQTALSLALWRKDKVRAEAHLATLCTALSQRRRWQMVRRLESSPSGKGNKGHLIPEAGEWVPDGGSSMAHVGFHRTEIWRGEPLRWSKSAAMVELNLPKGKHEVSLEWMPRATPLSLQFFVNERPVAREAIRMRKQGARVRFRTNREGTVRFGWVCNAHRAPGDTRELGIALRRLNWHLRP